MTKPSNHEILELIRTATEFVEDLKKLGYGESAKRPLPGAYDPFVEALKAARAKMLDQALEQDGQ